MKSHSANRKLMLFAVCVPIVIWAACQKKEKTTDSSNAYVCAGTPAQCLRVQSGWTFEDKVVPDAKFGDVSAIRLDDGRIRIYGNIMIDQANNQRAVQSYISDNGISFTKEDGDRLAGKGIHAAFCVRMKDGTYRLYYTDQSQGLINNQGSRSIKSAFSSDGLNFTIEAGDRLTYLGSGNETDGIGGGRPHLLKDGAYRMYYHGHQGGIDRLLSATSADGLVWTRENGVRLDPTVLCPPEKAVANNCAVIDSGGTCHLIVTTVRCEGQYKNSKSGIYDATSSDGLNFTLPSTPILEGYYKKDSYKGNPSDLFVGPQDPAVVITPGGARIYFGLYWGPTEIPESAIYSVFNPNLR